MQTLQSFFDQYLDTANRDVAAQVGEQALLEHGAVLSAFPIAEGDRARRKYSPLLINVAREGVAV